MSSTMGAWMKMNKQIKKRNTKHAYVEEITAAKSICRDPTR